MITSPTANRRLRLAALAVAATTALTLTACSSGGDEADSGADCVSAGDASKAVTVSGSFGAEPEVEFDAPLSVERTERSVVIEGDGDEESAAGDTVTISYTLFNGSTGETIESTGHLESSAQLPVMLNGSAGLPGLLESLLCASTGDRIVAVVPPAEAFGEQGAETGEIGADDSLVFVIDIVEPKSATDDLVVVEPDSEGMPTVSRGADGAPAVTIPDATPTEQLTLAVLAEGDGEVVEPGAVVEVQYTGVNWTSGETFDSSWSRGAPATFATNGVIPGFGAAIEGQPVGSQVVVVIPPAYGYGDGGNAGAGIAGDDTLVFVVDILAVVG